jgi:hypothetical protein
MLVVCDRSWLQTRTTTVIARLDRAIQYSEAPVIEQDGRGVLDHPLSRMMTM